MTHRRHVVMAALALLGAAPACKLELFPGAIDDPFAVDPEDHVPGSPGIPIGTPAAPVCKRDTDYIAARGPSPRLTARQFNNTVKALFPRLSLPDQTFPGEKARGSSFENDAAAQTASPLLIEQLQRAAQSIGEAAAANLGGALPCQPTPDEAKCGRTFVSTFLERAWRRPPTADEINETAAFFERMRASYGFGKAVALTVEAVLQTPDFLYLVRPGIRGTTAVALTTYELATRLSYLLSDSMPDDELYRAAKNGSLAQPAVLEAQARRLLATPAARAAVANFHRQWLRLDTIETMSKDTSVFPDFTTGQTPSSLRTSLERFVDYVFWGPGTVEALLTDTTAFVDDDLIPIYDLAMPRTGQWQTVKLDPGRRSGLLTQAGLLSALARSSLESPTLRGAFLMETFLCLGVPSPPPGVNTALPEAPSGETRTLRERLEQTHSQAACASCHRVIDGLGFGFQAYDALGQFRPMEAGRPVDAHGEVVGTRDANGPFDGALELSRRLAGSEHVRVCVANKWLGYALGRGTVETDACAIEGLARALTDSGGNMRELLVAVVKSTAFRLSRPDPP
jgi:Protein of unknown function (DUF1592)/Protein of unknown function (DUF1588)/Protein of unknown function (DUF1585)/Protein of unknown function (DUF1595)/Protein of unknown function (DUF1587)